MSSDSKEEGDSLEFTKEVASEKSLSAIVETAKETEMQDNVKNENVKGGSEKNESDKDFNEKEDSDKEDESEEEQETDKTSMDIDNKSNSEERGTGGNDGEPRVKEENGKNESYKDNNEQDGSEEESVDQEMGLLDRPVEVTGCRARKQVERLEVSFAIPAKDKQIPEGRGQKLGDCPRIEFQIAKHHVTDLKPLHRILFNRLGTMNDTKKNIRKFSGFSFDEDSVEFVQKKTKMEKLSNTILKGMCEILDIERGGTKEDIMTRLLQFLLSPSDSGKPLPKKKSSGRDKKKVSKKKSKDSSKKSKSKVSDEDDDEIAPSDDEVSDASANDKDEASDSEVKKKSKVKGRKTPIKVKTVKKEKPKPKKEQPKVLKRSLDVGSDSSDDDEPIAKKAKIPDDEDIKQLVKTILDQADLHEITMKKVIKQVYDTYPGCDLTDKKSFIKKTIKSVLKLNEEGKDR